jgi:hypothetical protein
LTLGADRLLAGVEKMTHAMGKKTLNARYFVSARGAWLKWLFVAMKRTAARQQEPSLLNVTQTSPISVIDLRRLWSRAIEL